MNLTFFPMHLTGLRGMPRRVWTYPEGLGWDGLNLLSTAGAYLTAAGIAVFVWDVIRPKGGQPQIARNPWGAGTLEFAHDVPEEAWGLRSIPHVSTRYPLWDQPKILERIDGGRFYLPDAEEGLRETLVTSVIDARPIQIQRVTGPAWITMAAAGFTGGAFILPTFSIYGPAAICGALAATCVIVWLWTSTARVPEAETKDAGLGLRLPTYASGPDAVGWWGMWITMLGDATAFASLVFGFFFYWTARPDFPPAGAAHADPYLAALFAGLAFGAWGGRRSRAPPQRRRPCRGGACRARRGRGDDLRGLCRWLRRDLAARPDRPRLFGDDLGDRGLDRRASGARTRDAALLPRGQPRGEAAAQPRCGPAERDALLAFHDPDRDRHRRRDGAGPEAARVIRRPRRVPLTPQEERDAFGEETSSIFRIALGPLIWALHFALSYAAVAIWCARFATEFDPIPGFRAAIGGLTILALAGIAWTGIRAFRQWNVTEGRGLREVAIDLVEEDEGRHEFLGHAALLLSVVLLRRRDLHRAARPLHSVVHLSARHIAATLGAGLAVALWTLPLGDQIGGFPAHMLRHALLVAVVPALLAPALPARRAPPPMLAAGVEFAAAWGWHLPGAHMAALLSPALGAAEQASFLLGGLGIWWAARAASPLGGAAALLLTSIHMTMLGAAILLAPRVLYPYCDLGAQATGAMLMLAVVTPAYLLGGLALARRALTGEAPA